jgi:hypothetical protein
VKTTGAAVLVVFFGALAVLLTWPLITVLGTHVPGKAPDDNVNFLWNLWWMREALASGVSPLHSDLLFAPFGVDLVLHTHSALNAIVAATVLSSFSLIKAQNILLIAAIAMNGFCAYLLARRLTSRALAAIAAGVYFASAPYFAGHLLGHFNLVGAWCLPLFALTLLRALEQPGWGRALAAGVVFALSPYMDYYYTVYLSAFVVVVAAWRWLELTVTTRPRARFAAADAALIGVLIAVIALAVWSAVSGGAVVNAGPWTISMRSGFNLRIAAWFIAIVLALRWFRPRVGARIVDGLSMRRDMRVLARVGAAVLVLTAPLWLAAGRLILSGDYSAPARLWRSSAEGVDLASLAAGNPFHPLWRVTGERIYAALGMSTIESTAWLGIAAVVFLIWRRHALRGREARLWILVAAVFFVWACGPYLNAGGVNTGLMLPETLLHFVPIVSNARIPGRAMVMVYLAIGMLLAYALASIRQRSTAAAIGLTAAVLADFISAPTHLFRLEVPPIYQQLATLPPGAVWEFPTGVGDGFGERGSLDNATMYYQTVHRHPLVGGFVARLSPRLLAAHEEAPALRAVLTLSEGRALADDERARAVDDVRAFMRAHDIRYIVVNDATAPPGLLAFVEALGLRVIATGDRRRVLVLE